MKLLPPILIHNDFFLVVCLFAFFFMEQGHVTSMRVIMEGFVFPEDMGFIASVFQVSWGQDVKVCNDHFKFSFVQAGNSMRASNSLPNPNVDSFRSISCYPAMTSEEKPSSPMFKIFRIALQVAKKRKERKR